MVPLATTGAGAYGSSGLSVGLATAVGTGCGAAWGGAARGAGPSSWGAEPADVAAALTEADAVVRRRACELAAATELPLAPSLSDADAAVVEAAAWALGERGGRAADAVEGLADVATTHDDPLCREAAGAPLRA